MHLPEEILHLIFSCVLEPPDAAGQAWLVDAARLNPLHATGYSVSLASRGLLPHGRRLLYTHLDTRDTTARPDNPRNFAARVDHLALSPHLARFVRSCTFEVQHDSTTVEADRVKDLIRCCPGLDSFQLVERPLGDDSDELTNLDWLIAEQHHRDLIRGQALVALALSHAGKQLRHLTLHAGERSWGVPMAFLPQCKQLRSLSLILLNPSPIEVPTQLPHFEFPHLVNLSLNNCHDALAASILEASPNLTILRWCSRHATVPTLAAPHETLSSVVAQVIRSTPETDLDVHLPLMASFLSSFTSLTSLDLLIDSYPHSYPPPAPKPATSIAFLKSLPSSLTSINFLGRALQPVSFSLTSLLNPRSVLPSLKLFCPFWANPDRVARTSWQPLADACAASGISLGGSLRLLFTKERLKVKMAEMRKTREDLKAMEERLEALWGSMSREMRVEEGWDPEVPPVRGSRQYDQLSEEEEADELLEEVESEDDDEGV